MFIVWLTNQVSRRIEKKVTPLHCRADGTGGRGRGAIGLSQILVAVKAKPAISNDLVLIFVYPTGPVEWGFDILSG